MTNGEAIIWLINISADIGKAEHSDLWHYEHALSEIREMLETAQPYVPDTNVGDTVSRQAAIDALCKECSGNCIPCGSFPCGEVEALQKLPSAQKVRTDMS